MSVLSSTLAHQCLQAASYLWAGLVMGISFLEAPVKFSAPTLTRTVGLDVGRHVFSALNKVEWGVAVLMLGLLVPADIPPRDLGILAGIGSILVLQSAWLLPTLRQRARAIIDGADAPSGGAVHIAYICLEGLKLIALLVVGWSLSLV